MTLITKTFRLIALLALLAAPLAASPLPAHALAAASAGKEKPAEDSAAEEPVKTDSIGRSTPRGTVIGFLDAIGNEDFEKASQYLDLSAISQGSRKARGPELARQLQELLDKGGWFYPSSMLSNERDGHRNEDEPAEDVDTIGNLRGNGQSIEIVAKQVEDKDNGKIWLISSQTLEQLPALTQSVKGEEAPINKILSQSLIEKKWFGAPAGHWIAAVMLLALSYVSVWFVALALVGLMKRIWTKRCTVSSSGHHFLDAVRMPIALYAAVWAFGYSSLWLGLSIVVRQHVAQLNVIVAWIAIALLVWRLIDIFAEAAQKKIVANGRFFGFSSILFFVRRIVKVVFGVVVLFILMANMGVDVTAGLAALGIGGIALALGAQKTLENFIGSVAIVIDQPLHIGDYCKIGDVAGTVEDIGMRSTRLRTNDRTLVTIPNGDLSNQKIENYARRNRFLINKRFQIRYDATAAQIRILTRQIQDILFASEYVTEEGFPVRYHGPGTDGHVIEIFCYVNVDSNDDYLRTQQTLLLQVVEAIEDMGLNFVIPAQTFLPALDQLGAHVLKQQEEGSK